MSSDVPRLMSEVLELFEEMQMDVFYSRPGEACMEKIHAYDINNPPPDTLPCSNADCRGGEIPLLETLRKFCVAKRDELTNDPSADRRFNFSETSLCQGHKYVDDRRYEFCNKEFKIQISGTFK